MCFMISIVDLFTFPENKKMLETLLFSTLCSGTNMFLKTILSPPFFQDSISIVNLVDWSISLIFIALAPN